LKPVAFLDGRVNLFAGDCLDVLAGLPENSVDSAVTDPPYHLTSIVKRFGGENAAEAKVGKTGAYARASAGFMGKKWDGGDIAFRPETWAAVLRVMKPGAHLLAFSGTRTYHRMVCAIEDAGFEIRDQIGFAFGSGFPKSHNVGNGWGSALKPAWEPIVLARKPLSEKNISGNVLRWGTGALNIDGTRIATDDDTARTCNGNALGRMNDDNWQAKPGEHGGHASGRWPANLIHDGSEEVLEAFPESEVSGSARNGRPALANQDRIGITSFDNAKGSGALHNDSGSAARFFYSSKADATDRLGSKHPTVKPLDLMQYLCRLITPPGGTVLDCFAGTGTTGEAAWREGFNAILIEREEEYQADIARRMDLAVKPAKRAAVAKTKGKLMGAEGTPLFGDAA
jgi:site-specific DNA-methyltransferase (adenine-specific)